jgi:hypothetical protein
VAVSFIGEGSRSILRKPPTCLKFTIFAVQLQFSLWYEGRTLMDNVDITIDEFVKSDTGWLLAKQSQINSNVSYVVPFV